MPEMTEVSNLDRFYPATQLSRSLFGGLYPSDINYRTFRRSIPEIFSVTSKFPFFVLNENRNRWISSKSLVNLFPEMAIEHDCNNFQYLTEPTEALCRLMLMKHPGNNSIPRIINHIDTFPTLVHHVSVNMPECWSLLHRNQRERYGVQQFILRDFRNLRYITVDELDIIPRELLLTIVESYPNLLKVAPLFGSSRVDMQFSIDLFSRNRNTISLIPIRDIYMFRRLAIIDAGDTPRSKPIGLPSHVVDALIRGAVIANECCPVTMEPLTFTDTTVTHCGHLFSRKVLYTVSVCPMCRCDL